MKEDKQEWKAITFAAFGRCLAEAYNGFPSMLKTHPESPKQATNSLSDIKKAEITVVPLFSSEGGNLGYARIWRRRETEGAEGMMRKRGRSGGGGGSKGG